MIERKGWMGLMGLCARAGKILSGEEMCLKAVRRGQVYLILIDSEASENAKKALDNACRHYGVPSVEIPKVHIGELVGKPERMTIAVKDAGLAQRILELIRRDQTTIGGAIGE